MLVGRVVGELWASRRAAALPELRLLTVAPISVGDSGAAEHFLVVAVDTIGAGIGEEVVVAYGHAARNALGLGEEVAVEAVVVGIVDDRQPAAAAGGTR